jgi:hypothetical protein
MKSPFPGMDPYLERHWLDVHTALIGELRRALNRALPADLVARAEERVAIESDEDVTRRIGPDVRVFSPSTADPAEGADGGVVIEAPYKLVVELEPVLERFIRIVDDGGELVTVIDVLSPTNKRPPGLDAYREKRAGLLAAGVHVVEIDLVRAGDWRAVMRPEISPAEARSAYRVTVRTSGARPGGYLFPAGIRRALPEIPIPLRAADAPLRLPLQPLLDAVYEDGRYDRTIDYARPLDPPLEPDDATWAAELLRGRAAHV